MRKLIYIILLSLTLSSCAKSLQPTTIEQEKQKQIAKGKDNQIVKVVLVLHVVLFVLIYDKTEVFN
jgi:hypothetical protein